MHALPQTIEALRKHIFNGVIWPDFSRLPSAEEPVLRFVPFAQGDVLDLGGRRVEVLTANHTVPAVGFALQCRPAARRRAEPLVGLHRRHRPERGAVAALAHDGRGALVIETAFSDEESGLARISRHLCPAMLGEELKQLGGKIDVHITHIKPGEGEAVMSEIAALGLPHRSLPLEAGEEMSLR